jgi:two-component system LytT family response regulator
MSWESRTKRSTPDPAAQDEWTSSRGLRRVAQFAAAPPVPDRQADRRKNATVAAPAPLERLLVGTSERLLLLRLAEVDWIQGDGNYVELHQGPATHRYRITLEALGSRLDPRRFARIHRSTLVNVDRVAELHATGNGGYAVVLHDGARLALSRGYKQRFFALLAGGPFTAPGGRRRERAER